MNLLTVASPKYFQHARQLLASYRQVYPDDKAMVCFFGCERWDDSGFDICEQVPLTIDHAWTPGMFYYKAHALSVAVFRFDRFIYCDARHRFRRQPELLESIVSDKSRFLVEYPSLSAYAIEWHTTQRCAEEMGCLAYMRCPIYWAAIQGWRQTNENINFLLALKEAMHNPLVAGPPNDVERPDIEDSPACLHHRNDQSALSLLIHKHGFAQSFSYEVSSRYGDLETIRALGGEAGHCWDHDIRGRQDG